MRRYCAALVGLAFAFLLTPDSARAQPGPPPLDMRVPFEPTIFAGAGRGNLMYELYLTNSGAAPLVLSRIEVRDAGKPAAPPVAAFDAAQLDSMAQPLPASGAAKNPRQIPAGATVVIFVALTFEPDAPVPDRLVHRVTIAGSAADGAAIVTHKLKLHELGPPLEGAGWLASDGPGNDPDNHHRRGLFTTDGQTMIARRFAIDWIKKENGVAFSGDARDVHNYYSYGSIVLAVADARVVTATDGYPDNVPGHNENFHPAVPITMETVAGNSITLDLGDGQYAHYMHLAPGTVLVRAGDPVKRGQAIAKVGGTGDAREPHLHFQVTTSPSPVAGEGIPYLIDRFGVAAADGTAQPRAHALPMNNDVVTFGGVIR